VRRQGVLVPIVPGVLAIQSTAQTRRFTALCGSRIPARLETSLAQVEQDDAAAFELGIDCATEQCEGLIAFGVPGIHFYSLNKSRSVMAISKNLSLSTFA
jgi:methylenetetrahydrofolate reductase (NADPH)